MESCDYCIYIVIVLPSYCLLGVIKDNKLLVQALYLHVPYCLFHTILKMYIYTPLKSTYGLIHNLHLCSTCPMHLSGMSLIP